MDIIKRKILIKKSLKPIDTDSDGVLDSLTLSADDLFLQIPLKQTIKDIGVYTDEPEEEEVINLDSIWDTSNDGSGEIEEEGDDEVITDYTDGEIFGGGGTTTVVGCMDPDASNYNSSATQACTDCCEFGTTGGGTQTGSGGSGDVGGGNVGSCHYLSGESDKKWGDYEDTAKSISEQWCAGTRSGCPKKKDCAGNGCGGEKCCPDPAYGKNKLVWDCPDDYDCKKNVTCCEAADKDKLLRKLYNNKSEDVTEYKCNKIEEKFYTSDPGPYFGCSIAKYPRPCSITVLDLTINGFCREECTDCEETKAYKHYWYFSCIEE